MAHETNLVTVFGYGATGAATVDLLLARGTPVRLVQRKRPSDLPAGVEFMTCDVLKPEDVKPKKAKSSMGAGKAGAVADGGEKKKMGKINILFFSRVFRDVASIYYFE